MRGMNEFLRGSAGASVAEYGLILGIVIVVGATGILALSPGVGTLYENADEAVAQNASAVSDTNGPGTEIGTEPD